MRETLKPDRFDWVMEPLMDEPSFMQRPMFGCLAYYLFGKLILVTAAKKDPWKGLLIPTSREFHESLQKEIPQLESHPVLGKWLYLRESAEEFEETAGRVVTRILSRDPRIGVEALPKAKRYRKKEIS